MKKKAYKAIDVKKIKAEQLVPENDERIIFGIDVAKEKNYCSLMNERREVLATVKWLHPFETAQFVDFAKKFRNIEVAMEPSGTYGDPIKYQLEKMAIPVFKVSPKRSHDAAEVYDGVASLHDAKSAAIIAKLHLDGASEKWKTKEQPERDLFAAITTLDTLKHQFNGNTNRLEALTARHWPEVNKYFKLNQITYLELSSRIGGPYQIAANREQAQSLMKKVGRSFFSPEKIDGVLESAATTIGVPMTDGELAGFKYLAARTLELKREIDKCSQTVEAMTCENQVTKNMGAVVGKTTAAVIMTFCGDPLNYDSCNHWLKSFGLNLKEKSSGNYKGRLMITKRGSQRSRKWLYFAVLRLVQKDKIVKAWYAKKIERDGGIKMKGLIAIMRKMVKALWHVARGEKFDTRKMFDAKNLGFAS